eukprot:177389_1
MSEQEMVDIMNVTSENSSITQTANNEKKEKEIPLALRQLNPVAIENATQIRINDMLTKLSLKGFLRPNEVYNTNYRPLVYVLCWIFMLLIPATFKYEDDHNRKRSLFWIYLVFLVLHFVTSFIVVLIANHNPNQKRNNKSIRRTKKYYYPKIATAKNRFIVKYFYICCGEINKLFEIQ